MPYARLKSFFLLSFECFWVAVDRAWHPRRLAYSDEVIAFALPGSEKLIDAIPLFELTDVVNMSDRDARSDDHSTTDKLKRESSRVGADPEPPDKKQHAGDKKSGDSNKVKFQHALQLHTKTDGYNSGRQYIIKARNDADCLVYYNNMIPGAKFNVVTSHRCMSTVLVA
jgi:hypothetical protein